MMSDRGAVVDSIVVLWNSSLDFFVLLIPKQWIYISVRLTDGTARIFPYHLMPRRDSNPQSSCTRQAPLKDAPPTALQRRGTRGRDYGRWD